MIRRIVKIDADKCNGCGACASACHEQAIAMINGKAVLIRDDYCDGLGDCLPACPAGAISFEEREAAAYDHDAVLANMAAKKVRKEQTPDMKPAFIESRLTQWPVQIKLLPIRAPYFDGADLLIAADCTAFAYGNFHEDFINGHVTLIGCPKLDAVDYSEKLAEIFRQNDIKSVTVTRMEVPCCGGIVFAVQKALTASGKDIPLKVCTIGIDGSLLK